MVAITLLLAGLLALPAQVPAPRDGFIRSRSLVGEPGRVLLHRKVSNGSPGFPDTLEPLDRFGQSVAAIGDLDGDGIVDLAAGAPGDDDGGGTGLGRGAVWILFRNADGSFRAKQKISVWRGGFRGPLQLGDAFGSALCGPGDVDGDGIPDLIVGAPGLTTTTKGSIWVLLLRRDGTVRGQHRIAAEDPAIPTPTGERFGGALATSGDWNGDGVPDVVVGGLTSGFAVFLFLAPDGTVTSATRIGTVFSSFFGPLAFVGDLDGDGREELVAYGFGVGWTLFLTPQGAIDRRVSSLGGVSAGLAGVGDLSGDGRKELIVLRSTGVLERYELDATGAATSLGAVALGSRIGHESLDGPLGSLAFLDAAAGRAALAVGAPDASASLDIGKVYGFSLVDLGAAGRAVDPHPLDDREGLMAGTLDRNDRFGASVAALGDVDGDGVGDLAVGAPFDEDLSAGRRVLGAVWIVFLRASGDVKATRKISAGLGGFTGILDPLDLFGASVAGLGDVDEDGVVDLAVGAPQDDGPLLNASTEEGTVWVLLLNRDGSVKGHVKIGTARGGFEGTLPALAAFGTSLAAAGDRDGNGTTDLFVGGRGTVHLLLLRRDGSVREQRRIDAGFLGLEDEDYGVALAALGDLDGDGAGDLAVGEAARLDGRLHAGAVWVLRLGRAGDLLGAHRIDDIGGGLAGPLRAGDRFGAALAAPGDLDGDGVVDLLVGAPFDDQDETLSGVDRGTVYVLLLNRDGTVRRELHIDALEGGFTGEINQRDSFGASLAVLGDRTRDGVPELAVGAPFDDDWRLDHGAVWLLALGGVATVDLEHRADGLTAFDGQALSCDELGAFVMVTGEGANLGAALFDSSLDGPNRFSPDPDLLVGRGNVLILQDSLRGEQTYPGLYDGPNDDADGGVLRFDLARPAHPRSIALIDVDDAFVRVRLTDRQGRERLYDVPPGWTGDRTTGAPGIGTLDLATLVPQVGHAATATAVQTPGFDADRVVRITVELDGSGAVDDLVLDPR